MKAKAIKKITIFLPALWGGGAERVFLNLAIGFAKKGYSVDLLLAQAEGSYMREVPGLPKSIRLVVLTQRHLNFARTLLSIPSLVKYLRQERPDALLTGLHANLIALWARRLAKVHTRIVISEHNTLSHQNLLLPKVTRMVNLQLIRIFYPWADRIVAVSNGVAADLAKVTGIPKNRIISVYNPIVNPELIEKAKANLDHPWFYPNEPPVIISIGRLTEQKDFFTLIEAFALVRQSKCARLIILGEGEQRPKLEALIKKLDLTQDVSMPGFVSNPYPYLTHANMFVLSSKWEGLPTVLVEALYCNVPVIATDCMSGPREILEDGKYGMLIPVGDHKSLAEAIIVNLNNEVPPQKESWQPFESDHVVDQYINLLVGE